MHLFQPTTSSQNSQGQPSYGYLEDREHALIGAFNQSLEMPVSFTDMRCITVFHEGEEKRLEMSITPSSWEEHHERKGYLVSSDLLAWRQEYFTKRGRPLDRQVLEYLGTFEYQLRLYLYPSLDEINHGASELSGVLLGVYGRIQRLEWSFLNIVVYKLCHGLTETVGDYISQVSRKLENLASFVEYFYDSMTRHIVLYDANPWWASMDCFYCCHQRGEHEQQLVTLKHKHLSRMELSGLLTALYDIKLHDVYSLTRGYGATSAEEAMAMPLINDATQSGSLWGRDVSVV